MSPGHRAKVERQTKGPEKKGLWGAGGWGGQQEKAECQALARLCLQDQLDGSSR